MNVPDSILEADISLTSKTSGNAGLIFRVSNPGIGADSYHGYFAGIGTDGYVTVGRADGGWKQLGNVPADIKASTVYHMKVQAMADSISVYIDDMRNPKVDLKDATFTSGTNGVRVYQMAATFDNIMVSPVVYDDFRNGDMNKWKVYDGSYDAKSNALVTEKSFGGKAVLNDSNFGDFTYEADVVIPTVQPGSSNVGLVFRVSNPGNGADSYRGYYAGIGTDGFIVLGRANQDWNQLSNVQATITAGTSYHLMVRAKGDALEVYLDDMSKPKISIRDATYKTGMAGVRVFQTGAVFDNIKITYL